MPITWKDYVGIRRIKIPDLIKTYNIETYEDLLRHVEKGDVLPPTREEIEPFLGISKTYSGVSSEEEIASRISLEEKSKNSSEYDWEKSDSAKVDISRRKPKRKSTKKKK